MRGRGLRRPTTPEEAAATNGQGAGGSSGEGAASAAGTVATHRSPDFGLYLLGEQPPEFTWTARWVRWPDFRLPSDRADALDAIVEAWTRAAHERVEVACAGGHGRTGTALACMAVLDGVDPGEAVAYVRAHYDAHAVETPWQKRYVRKFSGRPSSEAR
ncbi:putative-tyrosine phosphatase [Actinospica robiniae DSM 44927]|uniref:Putative-tyrosine phosphatase n=1 Tax=Actinospica robiniae DSM 44927 TaxID=479430 RepID=W9DYV7_9ACTN|nr:putative-tyrosine phosphatase [Actinospica robiniae DSM 44927]